jgi:NADH:ubiquinone oxidoreductase subunit 6 (subunit J)
MIADRSFGGSVTIQVFFGALSIAFLGALGMAIYNIRMKQIEQHRAWMLRAWIWAGSIITLRIMYVFISQPIGCADD